MSLTFHRIMCEVNHTQTPMGQISVTISDETEKLLEDLAKATGLTKSSLASEIIRRGLYEEASQLNKVAIFRKQQKEGLHDKES